MLTTMVPTLPLCLHGGQRTRLGVVDSVLMRQRIGDDWTRDRVEWTKTHGWAEVAYLPIPNALAGAGVRQEVAP